MKRSRIVVALWGGLLATVAGPAPHVGEAQEPAAPKTKNAEARSVADLSTKFLFVERYGLDEKAETIGPYRVGVRETIKVGNERPQGAPERFDYTSNVVFSERPAKLDGTGAVLATVRRYEAYRRTPDPSAKPSGPRLLEGLNVWYQPTPDGIPLVVSLTEGRSLQTAEFEAVRRQVFMPELGAVLPALAVRVGDRWSISKAGMKALLGMPPARGEPLTAELLEIRHAAKGPNWEAVIGIKGRVSLPIGNTAANARVVFSFAPPAPNDPPGPKPRDDEGTMTARGAIVDLRMGSVTTAPLPGENGRFRQTTTRELVLARQVAPTGLTLTIPEVPPTPNEANSWLTFDDPKGKFHFRYPQDFRTGSPSDGYTVDLFRPRPNGDPDTLQLRLQFKTGDAQADRMNRDPDFFHQTLKAEWKESKFDVLQGPLGWLPDAEWAPSKMKVYRVEVALRGSGVSNKKDQRVHSDYYLVLFTRDESLAVTAMTAQDPPIGYRKLVESIIRTFQFGPSKSR